MSEHRSDSKDDQEFAKTIDSLKRAEEESREVRARATEAADAEVRAAREKAEVIIKKAQEEAVALKDKALLEAKEEIESERAVILKKAEKEAEGFGKKRLKAEDAKKMAMSIFE